MDNDRLPHIEALLEDIRDLLIWQNSDDLPRQYWMRLSEILAEHKAMKKRNEK